MKLDKLTIFYLVVTLTAIIFTAGFFIGKGAKTETYALTAVVTDIDENTDIVLIKSGTGLTWCFYGVEDWSVGDIASCVMDTKGTEIVFDDEIVSVQYGGYFEMWD